LLVDRPNRVLIDSRSRDGFRYAIARDGVREQVLFDEDLLTRAEYRQGDVLSQAGSARDMLEEPRARPRGDHGRPVLTRSVRF
jgi:hypothetical protein